MPLVFLQGHTRRAGKPLLLELHSAANALWRKGGVLFRRLVEIKHPGGLVTRYGHNSGILVTVGQHVDQGSVIAIMGSTGNSTGPHCHYEVRVNGTAVDPLYFLPGNYAGNKQ
ncbi:M23 family metallopeptidase [Bilophila wadsworthia]|uniref:M23 family metallopeptidase n=1 Tax=Bilophila wadsworthia TaxID=35833 RepID=UPI003AB6C4CD